MKKKVKENTNPTCPNCKKEFVPKKKGQKYCSNECYLAHTGRISHDTHYDPYIDHENEMKKERERREMQKRLRERDLAYEKAFPSVKRVVKRDIHASEGFTELYRRFY